MQHLLRLSTDSYSGCGRCAIGRRSIRASKQQVHKFTVDAFSPNEQMSAPTRGMKNGARTYDISSLASSLVWSVKLQVIGLLLGFNRPLCCLCGSAQHSPCHTRTVQTSHGCLPRLPLSLSRYFSLVFCSCFNNGPDRQGHRCFPDS